MPVLKQHDGDLMYEVVGLFFRKYAIRSELFPWQTVAR